MSEAVFSSIPAGWELTTLGDVCKRGGGLIQTGPFGSQLHSSDYVDSGIPVIMPLNIGVNRIVKDGIARITEEDAGRLSRHRVIPGDIVYSRRGDVERRALVRTEQEGWLCGTGCLLVRAGERGPDSSFISFYLGHPAIREWIVRHAIGATMPNLNTGILKQVPLLLPPKVEQLTIASILAQLEDQIELNRRMNETLEAIARAIFKSWFVDFDPVRAKADGHQAVGMDTETAALFPDSFEDSPMGLIPSSWTLDQLSNVIELIGGGTPKTSVSEYWGGGIPWFSVTDVPALGDVFVIKTEKTITREGLDDSSTRLLSKGTTIITARGTVGKCALVGTPMAMNQSCYGIKAKNGLGDYYTYFLVRHAVTELQQKTHGSVFETITRETFKNIQVVQPTSVVIGMFEKEVTPILESVLSNLYQSRTLVEIRDILLPKLISGDIRVKDAEKFVEEHAG